MSSSFWFIAEETNPERLGGLCVVTQPMREPGLDHWWSHFFLMPPVSAAYFEPCDSAKTFLSSVPKTSYLLNKMSILSAFLICLSLVFDAS